MADESSSLTTLHTAGDWNNEANLTGSHDSSCADSVTNYDYSGQYTMSFSAVEGTINGIEVLVHYSTGDTNDFVEVTLRDPGTVWQTRDAAAGGTGTGCTDCTDQTVGGPTDLWDTTWTAAHIKSSNFRLRLRCRSSGKSGDAWRADHCTVKVYYTAAAATKVMVVSMT